MGVVWIPHQLQEEITNNAPVTPISPADAQRRALLQLSAEWGWIYVPQGT